MEQDPLAWFTRWFEEAGKAGIAKHNAMTLATTDAAGRPDARIVLLSSFDERGFVFHTNYDSDKGRQLAANDRATLVFWWDMLGYQVRIAGAVEKTTPTEADAYFAGRPRGSQLGAWASPQSRHIADRDTLTRRVKELELQYANQNVPRPPHWGGYRLVPQRMEFWIDRPDRLHDRFLFLRGADGSWEQTRLAP